MLDLTLEVGTIEESITVSGQTPLIETANASHGTVLDRDDARDATGTGARRVPHGGLDPDGHRLG